MKTLAISSLLLLSSATFASTSNCQSSLLEKINKDPNIRVIKLVDSYTCGQTACAITFEHDMGSPYPVATVLAFLDTNNNLRVNWVPLNGSRIYGHEDYAKNKVSYVSTAGVGDEKISIEASIETPRDAIFWPPHRVYFEETVSCLKD
jgi:hypothetical protein